MKAMGKVHNLGIGLGLLAFVFFSITAWAVVPTPVSPVIENAERVQTQKQDVIRIIKDLKKRDGQVLQEIRNELEQSEEKTSNAFLQNETCAERH